MAAVPPPHSAGGRCLLRFDHRRWPVVLRRQFHSGFFPDGRQTLAQALDAHTDLVCELAGILPGMRVLDVGCGIGEPARRIASRIDCEIVGLNISREQVRQGRELIARAGLAARVDIRHGNALHMPLPEAGFDAAICLEAGGDICVRAADKPQLLAELTRVLRPGGQVGFSDLVFGRLPTAAEDRALRALLYHSGRELFTDWPGLFAAAGFQLGTVRDIQAQTLPTWQHVQATYRQHAEQVQARYGRRLGPAIARPIDRQVAQVAAAIKRCGSYPALSATTPSRSQGASDRPEQRRFSCTLHLGRPGRAGPRTDPCRPGDYGPPQLQFQLQFTAVQEGPRGTGR
jgi:cyclopropane fatty-acyl-phospholipid synthase-like methyltransferase